MLSKGHNAGKPLEKPCPNCFTVIVNDEGERLSLYWLCYALWQGGCFRQYLCGSVIEFLHIGDARKVLLEHASRMMGNPDMYQKYLNLLQNLLVYEHKLKEQLQKLKTLKSSLAIGTFCPRQTSPPSQS